MKKCFCVSGLPFLLSLLLVSCVRDESPVPVSPDDFSVRLTVSEAKGCFERQAAATTRTSAGDNDDLLTLGLYSPDWSEARLSTGDVLYSADIPVTTDYAYYQYETDERDSVILTPMFHKLVVVKDGESEAVACYIRFYMPTREHAATHDREYYDAMLNSDCKTGFTGMSVYTTLDGFPVCAGRYSDGELVKSAFLGDTIRSLEENYIMLANLLDGLKAARVRPQGTQTRTTTYLPAPPKSRILIEPVEIVGKPILPRPRRDIDNPFSPPLTVYPIDEERPDIPTPGGGGGNNSQGDDGTYRNNKNIQTTDPKIKEELDHLMEDCLGEKLIKNLTDKVTICQGRTAGEGSLTVTPHPTILGNWSHNTYVIKLDGVDKSDLIEELTHLFQHSGLPPSAVRPYKMNNEIEAKLGWYLALVASGEFDANNYEGRLGGDVGVDAFEKMGELYVDGNWESDAFRSEFENAVTALRRLYPEIFYPYDPTKRSCPVLQRFIGDCVQKIKASSNKN